MTTKLFSEVDAKAAQQLLDAGVFAEIIAEDSYVDVLGEAGDQTEGLRQ